MIAFGSLFAGIGGFDLGLERAGMRCAWQVEIDDKARSVLARHWPDVDRGVTDVKEAGRHNLAAVDVVCGGFPCQGVSVAGRREGLADERSGLWFQFHRILGELAPRWVIVENVPGLLSSNGGRDFATVISGLVELGYGVCWRILDAQYFGVAQRRRRVFIVGHLGNGRAAEVLFEREGSTWNPAPSREAGARVAMPLTKSFAKHHGASAGKDSCPHNLICSPVSRVLTACKTATGRLDPNEQEFVVIAQNGSDIQVSNQLGAISASPYADNEAQHEKLVTFELFGGGRRKDRPAGGLYVRETDTAKALDTAGLSPCFQGGVLAGGVRRLTPVECERLQGFPDGWTEGQSDSARYRQSGNAVAEPCAEWIGRRIVAVEAL